jgi:succinyl-CoA synthetase beta subunit
VAARTPEAIHKMPFHPLIGLQAFQARALAYQLGFGGKLAGQAVNIMLKLARVFLDTDASLAEINPLVLTKPAEGMPEGQLLAIDAKFNFDDSGLFRHQNITDMFDPSAWFSSDGSNMSVMFSSDGSNITDMFDPSEENQAELRAKSFGLSYVALDGNIGCLVNGAGLAMSTMDLIKLHGGEPANFLDVGGSATEEAVTEAFRIILADENVQAVLVNIFGGIMECDKIARAIIAAAKEVGFKVPLVVRLEGTNVAEARRLLDEARAEIPTMVAAADLTDAAKKVCAAATVTA